MNEVTYAQLNEVLCDALFSRQQAHKPVYIEMQETTEIEVAGRLSCTPDEVRPLILHLVKERIENTGTSTDPFWGVHRNLLSWRLNITEGNVTNYPELPLLVLFTFAAMEMGGEGDYNPNAYYPRLQKLLGTSTKETLANSYRDYSKTIWGSLNIWLDVFHKGKMGVGTAYSIGTHRHVGYALSQALIRSGDRKKLPALFRRNGFSAFSSMVEHDMESTLEEWVSEEESQFGSYRLPSRPFRDLWEKADARERISAIVCRELESWDGSVPKILREDGRFEDDDEIQVRLEATRASFPSPALNISFAVSGFTVGTEKVIQVVSSDDCRHPIALSIDPSGWLRPNVALLPISEGDLLENALCVEYGEKLKATRPPKKIVVLKFDDLTRRYRETDRIELGIRALVLVQDNRTAVEDVTKILENSARLDWKKVQTSDLKGLPANWTLFSDVELLQPPPLELLKHANLEALKPVRTGTLTFSSGLQLPGRPPKWHGAAGLEIRATVVGTSKLTVAITELVDGEEQDSELTSYSLQTIIHKIEPGQLADGDYKVEIFADEIEEPLAKKMLLIRSADTADLETWKNSERLVYDLKLSPSATLNATPLSTDELFVIDGALPVFEELIPSSTRVPYSNEWWGTRTPIIESRIRNFQLLSASAFPCFTRGNHFIELPPALPNRKGTGFLINESGKIEGRCRECGLTRRSPADPYVLQRMHERRMEQKFKPIKEIVMPRVDLKALPAVDSQAISWDLALDALMHLGGGSDAYLSSIASNVDPSALFRHEFIRALEMLAYFDISRDSEHQLTSWELNPSFVVQTESDFFLTGYWPPQFWTSIAEFFGEEKVFREPIEGSFSRMTLRGMSAKEIEDFLTENEIEATIVIKPAVDMLRMLPNIKAVAENLPSLRHGIFDEVSIYDADQNSWLPTSVSQFEKVGGYRLSSAYRNQYAVVTDEDLGVGKIRYTSAEFAKFFCTSVLSQRPLFAYHQDRNCLVVPKGAPLPGMYGRAAVMATGYLPKLDSSKRYLVYKGIKKEFAEILAAKIGGQ